ncbi:MAG: hypothetical protein WC359_13635 [Dehalococcoidia bacterium]|jgi:phage FluMu protein Com
MANIGECVTCGYPLQANYAGQKINCPNCNTINQAISGVTIPTWMLASGIGLVAGIVLGPAILASTETGAEWLRKQARSKLGG